MQGAVLTVNSYTNLIDCLFVGSPIDGFRGPVLMTLNLLLHDIR